MPRKEVINKFDKGLMMDANPLSTSPEVLTSALNVTLITFNGSEFILQSDMGNGRGGNCLPARRVRSRRYGGVRRYHLCMFLQSL